MVTDIEKAGATLVVISPQLEKYTRQMAKKHHLTYSVLMDQDNGIAAQFGLKFKLPDDLREVYTKFGIDLERFNGSDAWTLPLPGRFILERNGIIQDVQVDPDYTKRPEPGEVSFSCRHSEVPETK